MKKSTHPWSSTMGQKSPGKLKLQVTFPCNIEAQCSIELSWSPIIQIRQVTAHGWMIVKVESSSTFPTITTLPTKTIFNGNVCLRWSVSYRRHTIVRLETRPIRLEVRARLFLLASQRNSGTLVCDRFRFKWKHLPAVFTIVCDKTNADNFQSSQTVADHMETRLYIGDYLKNNYAFSLTQLISSPVISTKRLSAILKNCLGDYKVIITSSTTNQRREFSIITYVIILNLNVV